MSGKFAFLILICFYQQGVSELTSNLQNPASTEETLKESIIVGIPVPVEKAASVPNNVFFLVRNPAQFPSAIERLVVRIQNYFSSYNSLEALNDRPRPTSNSNSPPSKGNSSIVNSGNTAPLEDGTSNINSAPIGQSNVLSNNVPSNNVTSSSLRLNVVQDNANPSQYNSHASQNQEPDRIYEIPVGPYSINEPPETNANEVASSTLNLNAPVEAAASHLNEIHYRGGPHAYQSPVGDSNVSPLSVNLLPPGNPDIKQEQSAEGGYLYPSPCSTTSSSYNSNSVPCLPSSVESSANEVDVTSTTQATYLPPYKPEEEVQGPFVIESPETSTPGSSNTYEENKVTGQTLPCSNSIGTTLEPTTSSTTTKPPCQTTTEKPTTTTTERSTTTTTVRTTTTTVQPCYTTTTTTKPTTTTKKPTTKRPCHTSTTSKPSTLPCQHVKTSTEPAWTYLPPHKVTTEPNHHTTPPNYYLPPSSRKPLFYLPPKEPYEDLEHDSNQATNQIHIHFQPFFHHHRSKFLLPLKRLLGLA